MALIIKVAGKTVANEFNSIFRGTVLLALFQIESWCTTFHMEMSCIFSQTRLYICFSFYVIVQRMDNAFHRINHFPRYPVDSY